MWGKPNRNAGIDGSPKKKHRNQCATKLPSQTKSPHSERSIGLVWVQTQIEIHPRTKKKSKQNFKPKMSKFAEEQAGNLAEKSLQETGPE